MYFHFTHKKYIYIYLPTLWQVRAGSQWGGQQDDIQVPPKIITTARPTHLNFCCVLKTLYARSEDMRRAIRFPRNLDEQQRMWHNVKQQRTWHILNPTSFKASKSTWTWQTIVATCFPIPVLYKIMSLSMYFEETNAILKLRNGKNPSVVFQDHWAKTMTQFVLKRRTSLGIRNQ